MKNNKIKYIFNKYLINLLLFILSIVIAQFPQNQIGGGPPQPQPPVNIPIGNVNQGQNIGQQGSQLFSGIGDNLLYGGIFLNKIDIIIIKLIWFHLDQKLVIEKFIQDF
jgi:hypothetical protein